MLRETFQVATITEKLPPAWKDFKNYLKHKRKEMSIEYLVIRLRIKEDNRGSEKKMAHNPNEAKANFLEHGQSSKFKKGNNKGKDTKLGPKGRVSKKKKFLGKCFNCGKQGHKSSECRHLRRKWHTILMRLRLTLWNMVKVPSLRKATTKGKTLSWDLKGDSPRRKRS